MEEKDRIDHRVGAIECPCFQNVKLWFITSAFTLDAKTYSLHHQCNDQKFEASYGGHARITAFGGDWDTFMGTCSIERNHFPARLKFVTKYQHWTWDV